MSDTPRTDAIIVDHPDDIGWTLDDFIGVVDARFARTLERENAAMREALKELQYIADAKPSTWGEMADQFQPWAQNRARHALAKLQPFLKP